MKHKPVIAALLVTTGTVLHAATLEVGTGRTYATLAAASAAARDNDTVLVYPGTYASGATWAANGLTIRSPEGSTAGSVIVSTGTVGGKGLFVTQGADIVVDGIRFENARVADQNGAGIRAEGRNLTVRNAIFVNNENGILATLGTNRGTVTVSRSRFEDNGSNGFAHGIYAVDTDSLVVADSTFVGTRLGHHIKSRATSTTVRGNTLQDGAAGTASYVIEVPNGGTVTIENNVMQKGPQSSNRGTAIALGFEGASNAAGPIVVRNNQFANETGGGTNFVDNRTTTPATLEGNTFTGGQVTPLVGMGTVSSAPAAAAAPSPTPTPTAAAVPTPTPSPTAVATPVPEPQALALFAMGALGVVAARRRR